MTKELTAYTFCQETIGMKNTLERNYIVLCQRLHTIRENQLYDGNYGSWELFLEELRINKRKADAMCKIYETFILELGISEEKLALAGGWSVAETILPIATDKESAEEALEFAAVSLRKDVRMYVNEKLGKVPDGICEHEDTYVVRVCRGCSERWQEHE